MAHGMCTPVRRRPGRLDVWARNSEVWCDVKFRFRNHPSLLQQVFIEHLLHGSPEQDAHKAYILMGVREKDNYQVNKEIRNTVQKF